MSSPSPSPFVGPRPLAHGEQLLGRDKDLRTLVDMLRSRRIVILHGDSGVGKTSLIQAGLAPELKRAGFDMWKPIRIHDEVARFVDVADDQNAFLLSAMVSLEDELPRTHRRSASALAKLSFREYIETRPRRKKRAKHHVVLVFDQLEDLFLRPGRSNACQAFFEAVGEGLENETYWALFVVRDELLAKLTLYHHWIPTRMSNTFHLGPLTTAGAKDVIEGLARTGERRFTNVDALVDELSTVEATEPSGRVVLEHGRAVDPLHLQVICRRLWATTPNTDGTVDSRRLGPCGDPLEGLCAYYGAVTRRVAQHDIEAERRLRTELARLFITDGRRVQLPEDFQPPANLEPDQVDRLLAYDLLHVEAWGPDRWLELSHQRLAEAIIHDNEAWERANPVVVARLKNMEPSWSDYSASEETGDAAEAGEGSEQTELSLPNPSESTLSRQSSPNVGDWAGATGEWDADQFAAVLAQAEQQRTAERPKRVERNEQTEVSERTKRSRERQRPAPAKRSPINRALSRSIAQASLQLVKEDPLLELAMLTLATRDPRWMLPATGPLGRDDDRLLGHLDLMLAAIIKAKPYTNVAENERPDLPALLSALVELGAALHHARGPRKRAILLAAFHANFVPAYFISGMNRHLWSIACAIEHPELLQLKIMIRDYEVGAQIGLHGHETSSYFVHKLATLGLVVSDHGPAWIVTLSELAATFLDFLRRGGLTILPEDQGHG